MPSDTSTTAAQHSAPSTQHSFTAGLREAAEPIWQQQRAHPFVQGLADGTLPSARFLFYIRQDAVFLRELNRVFGYGAARAGTPDEQGHFAQLLLETTAILADLHGRYAASGGLDAATLAATPPAPTTYAYTRHLLWTAAGDSYAALLAALLPSMWMYDELGQDLAARGTPPADHPYRDWLLVHAGPHLETVTAWMRESLDRLAPLLPSAERDHLTEVFLISSRYELLFWDMTWREESWPY